MRVTVPPQPFRVWEGIGGRVPAVGFREAQANNIGPSSSTSKLAPKVDKGELLVANGDVQMNFAQSASMPNLGIWFPAKEGGKPTTFALPYAAGLVADAPHTANGKKLLDFMLAEQAQKQVSEIGGGFPARKDVKPVDANAIELAKLLEGVRGLRAGLEGRRQEPPRVHRRVEVRDGWLRVHRTALATVAR